MDKLIAPDIDRKRLRLVSVGAIPQPSPGFVFECSAIVAQEVPKLVTALLGFYTHDHDTFPTLSVRPTILMYDAFLWKALEESDDWRKGLSCVVWWPGTTSVMLQ